MLLCRTVCHCTLDELGVRMSAREFGMWWDEYVREPWGEYRADIRSACEQANVANFAGKSLKKTARVSASDFLLNFEREEPKEVPPEEFFKGLN